MAETTFLSFHDLISVLPLLNRRELCNRTGLSYDALKSKIYRYNKGQTPHFTKQESQQLRDYLFDLRDKIEIILISE